MIYTIGHTKNYERMFRDPNVGQVFKMPGGYAFKTVDEAQRRIDELNMNDFWSIYQMNATMEDTTPDPTGGWWRVLKTDAAIEQL